MNVYDGQKEQNNADNEPHRVRRRGAGYEL